MRKFFALFGAAEDGAAGALAALEIKKTFKDNYDFESRRITVGGEGGITADFFYVDGLVSGAGVAERILRPLTDKNRFGGVRSSKEVAELILAGAVYGHSVKLRRRTEDAVSDMLCGFCALVLPDGRIVTFEARTADKRSVDAPKEEKVVRGSKDAFVETLKTNTSLVRQKIHDPRLKIKAFTAGEKTATGLALVYIDGFTDGAIVAEAERRLKNIRCEGVLSTAMLEDEMTDTPVSPFPQMISTERPDKFCVNLLEGRVGVLVDGLPIGFLVPATFSQFMKVPEDHSGHFLMTSMLTLLRYVSFLIALILPAFYVAVAMYHQELIPIKLLQSIIDAKQSVPFPTAFEALAMLVAFELLQEAGLRLPNPVGETVSIIGALIVGQSAVDAKVVSPTIVVVVALSGICGYTMPDNNMSSALRLFRLIFVVLAIFAGMFGLALGFTAMVYHLASLESFGVPYMSPFAGAEGRYIGRALARAPMTKKRHRDPTLHPEDGK